eukprot:8009392-Pyramimonas_sp.AAC.1
MRSGATLDLRRISAAGALTTWSASALQSAAPPSIAQRLRATKASRSDRSLQVSGPLPLTMTSSPLGAALTGGPFSIERFAENMTPLVAQQVPMEKYAAKTARKRFIRTGCAVNVLA